MAVNGKGEGEKRKWFQHESIIAIVSGGVFLAVILALFYAGFLVWKEYKRSIIDSQKKQMLLTAESLGDSLELLFQEYTDDMDTLYEMFCGNAGMDGEGIAGSIASYVSHHSPYVYDAVYSMGPDVYPASLEEKEIYSISRLDAQTVLYMVRLADDMYCLCLKRTYADDFGLCLYIDSGAYYEDILSKIRLGSSGYVMVKDSNGIILMHPSKQQWGIHAVEGRIALYNDRDLDLESLSQMIDEQNQGQEGVVEYYSYWWQEEGAPRVKKISAYVPAWIGEDFLVVSAVIDYNDIYVPIAEGFIKLILVFIGILAAMSALGFCLVKLFMQKKKDMEKIEYLTKLNEILEEMHQSEDALAHQQRLQIMGTMTGGIAHEFNNLLTPIVGYADLLMMEVPEESEAYEYSCEIADAAAKAKEIIQQISSLSRKNMETAYKTLEAGRVVKRAMKMVRSVCPANVRLKEELCLDEAFFLGNETQLNQVILNICVNAIHAIGRGEGHLTVNGDTVRAQKVASTLGLQLKGTWERYIRLRITDDGCGMTEEVLKQIFDPFFTTKKNGQGTGLGLAVAEQIITSHKGHIFAESSPGKGTTFYLFLPMIERTKEGEPEACEGEDKRILIADDNAKVLKLLEKNLSRHGVKVSCALGFEEARAFLKKQKYDVLVVKQQIFGEGGVDFCMSAQGLCPGMVKIVMADRVTKELAEARQRGLIDAYIETPVSDMQILTLLNRF